MSMGIYSALSGLKVKETELDVVAHNMSNVNTTGYKEQNMVFEAVLSKTAKGETPYVDIKEKNVNSTSGPIMTTNNPFDLAIQGDGFFEVQNEKGAFLTKNGAFVLNSNGDMVTAKGDRLMGTNGPIKIEPGSHIVISAAGIIMVDGEEKGQVKISKIANKEKLQSIGGTLFKAADDVVVEKDTSSLVFQGKLEQSNTNVMKSLVKLIEISKQYQSYQKIISNQGKMEQDAVASLGRVG